MKIESNTGTLYFNEITIHPEIQIQDLKNLMGDKLLDNVHNGIYNSYGIRNIDDGDLAIGIYFTNDKLSFLDVSLGRSYGFEPFSTTDEEIAVVKEKMMSIGGEQKYEWGKISLLVDPKSGIVSIVIRYLN